MGPTGLEWLWVLAAILILATFHSLVGPSKVCRIERNLLSEVWAWFQVGIACVVLLFFLRFSWHVFRRRVESRIRRELAVALRSAAAYLLMTVPMLVPSLWNSLMFNFKKFYHWLPFWYCFVMSPMHGTLLELIFHSLVGTVSAFPPMVLLNYLMPGGAGPLGKDRAFTEHAWLPGGYNEVVVCFYAALFVYCILWLPTNVLAKKYSLAIFGDMLVRFMNPTDDESEFKGVLWDWDFKINVTGPLLCQFYIILLAGVVAACSVPTNPFRPLRKQHSCLAHADVELDNIAADSIGCLERLVGCFCRGSENYEIGRQSSWLFVKQLGARRKATEEMLHQARWEIWSKGARRKRARLIQFASILRDFRQVLRVSVQQIVVGRAHFPLLSSLAHGDAESETSVTEIEVHMEEFLVGYKDALFLLKRATRGRGGDDDLSEALKAAQRADYALVAALGSLSCESRATLFFIDNLRTLPGLIEDFTRRPEEVGLHDQKSFFERCYAGLSSRRSHFFAARGLFSWMLALLWSVHVRGSDSGCVVSMSYLFSTSLGSLFEVNTNRIIGVGLGVVLGNIPGMIFMEKGLELPGCFHDYPQGLILTMVWMLIMWTLAMYGYFASEKWSLACVLWAGFGGVHLIRHFQRMGSAVSEATPFNPFEEIFNNIVACVMILFWDLLFAYSFQDTTLDHVGSCVPQCLEDAAVIIECLRIGDLTSSKLEPLSVSIEMARFWDSEVHKDDLVWSMLWQAAYKEELVLAILSQCDHVFENAYAVVASTKRCNSVEAAELLNGMLPSGLEQCARTFAQEIRVALLERAVDAETPKPRSNDWQLVCSDLRAPELPGLAGQLDENSWRQAEADSVTKRAARAAMVSGALEVLAALREIRVLLREQSWWASSEWRFARQLSCERSLSSLSILSSNDSFMSSEDASPS